MVFWKEVCWRVACKRSKTKERDGLLENGLLEAIVFMEGKKWGAGLRSCWVFLHALLVSYNCSLSNYHLLVVCY